MEVIDLTHTISQDMPVYPGTEPPSLEGASTFERDGFKETLMSMFSHTGTHMDPPAHIFPDGRTLDSYPASYFVGKGLVIDCTDLEEGDLISADAIRRYGDEAEHADYLLFSTGWDRFWGKPEYFGEYPCLSPEAVELVAELNPRGIGFDTIGIDPIADTGLSIHHTLLSQGMVFIENMRNLDRLKGRAFTLFALPLKWEDADGAPIRAIAVCD